MWTAADQKSRAEHEFMISCRSQQLVNFRVRVDRTSRNTKLTRMPRNQQEKMPKRASWDQNDLRKLYVFCNKWIGQHPDEHFKPSDAKHLFPNNSVQQISSFYHSDKFANYIMRHGGVQTLAGKSLFNQFFDPQCQTQTHNVIIYKHTKHKDTHLQYKHSLITVT